MKQINPYTLYFHRYIVFHKINIYIFNRKMFKLNTGEVRNVNRSVQMICLLFKVEQYYIYYQ